MKECMRRGEREHHPFAAPMAVKQPLEAAVSRPKKAEEHLYEKPGEEGERASSLGSKLKVHVPGGGALRDAGLCHLSKMREGNIQASQDK